MVAEQNDGVLVFPGPQARVEIRLVIVLSQITSGSFVIDGLQINAVPRRELLLERGRKNPFFEVIIRPLAWIGAVKGFQGVAAVAKSSILRARLRPGAAAQVFGAGDYAEAVALEELRILLLGDALGKGASADGREEVGDEVLAVSGRLVPEIDPVGITQL